jgi:hypothetical protein
MASLSEQRTAQFYQWETRCRGWNCYDAPVQLEPSFEPFIFRKQKEQYTDDGLRPTIVSSILDFVSGKTKQQEEIQQEEQVPLAPFLFENDAPLEFISVSVPKGYKVKAEEMQQLLCMLSYSRYPISFEIIASHTLITIQFACREPDSAHVHNQIKAYFPESIINIKNDVLLEVLERENQYGYIVDFGLSEEFMRPIKSVKNFDLDPYIGLFGMLENLGVDESAAIQILFQGTQNAWAESIVQSVTDSDGKSFFLDAPDMTDLAKEKVSSPLYAVTVRTMGISQTFIQAQAIAGNIGGGISYLSYSETNALLPLVTEAYEFELRLQDVALRQSHRQGMILNSKELATLVHFPSASVVSHKLNHDTRKTKAVPKNAIGNQFIIGRNTHQGKEQFASINNIHRLKHTHIIGATGTGKSTLLLSSIVQDIEHGEGIAVLDPHGDLIESILAHIPPERMDDVILIDPADADYPVGFNILSAYSEIEKDILSSDLVAVFRRLSTSWGDQMNSVFANAILAILESEKGGTLVDLRRFLIEKSFRDSYLKSVIDPSIVYYWQKEFPLLKSGSIGPILTRLDTFLRPKVIRYMVAQKKGPDFEQILDSKKILLVKLSQGLIGTENSYLLGTFIVSKIQQAAMARQMKSKESRGDFFLYIDEFQNFITPSMSTILSGARKYHLGLILAHQDMQQLVKQDLELASSVVSNAGTRICFRLGDTDAKRFESGFSFFDSQDLQNLDTGEAIARVERPEYDFTIDTIPILELDAAKAEGVRNVVIAKSRERYGTPKKEIEALFEVESEQVRPETVKEETIVFPTVQKKEEKLIAEELKLIVPPVTPTLEANTPSVAEKKAVSQHRYLQTLIKKMAEARGYKASIEEQTPDRKGKVDVALERNGKKIACEVSVTSTDIYEVHNMEKCLSAGYDLVVECSTDTKTLENIRKAIELNLSATAQKKILVFTPDELFLYLDKQVAKDASSETLIKGYRVKVEYDAVSEEDMKKKRDTISQVVVNSLKNTKK